MATAAATSDMASETVPIAAGPIFPLDAFIESATLDMPFVERHYHYKHKDVVEKFQPYVMVRVNDSWLRSESTSTIKDVSRGMFWNQNLRLFLQPTDKVTFYLADDKWFRDRYIGYAQLTGADLLAMEQSAAGGAIAPGAASAAKPLGAAGSAVPATLPGLQEIKLMALDPSFSKSSHIPAGGYNIGVIGALRLRITSAGVMWQPVDFFIKNAALNVDAVCHHFGWKHGLKDFEPYVVLRVNDSWMMMDRTQTLKGDAIVPALTWNKKLRVFVQPTDHVVMYLCDEGTFRDKCIGYAVLTGAELLSGAMGDRDIPLQLADVKHSKSAKLPAGGFSLGLAGTIKCTISMPPPVVGGSMPSAEAMKTGMGMPEKHTVVVQEPAASTAAMPGRV